MRVIRDIAAMQQISQKLRRSGKHIGFVPTMGALHEGHLSLIRGAIKENDYVAVSIFVNPAQFGPGEDLKDYPRDFRSDVRLCQKAGVDIVFFPDVKKIYPPGYKTYVTVRDLSGRLCGKFRPGHFQGVATVVTKLFNIVNPDTAYFGQKDAQQAQIIKSLVRDLNMPLRIKVMPTVREKDGLALSSRNAYLTSAQRNIAPAVYEALKNAKELLLRGERNYQAVISKMQNLLRQRGIRRIDYISIVDLENLKTPVSRKEKVLIALAVRIGKTRLIDNCIARVN